MTVATTRPIEWVIAIAGGLALAATLVTVLRDDSGEVETSPASVAQPASITLPQAPNTNPSVPVESPKPVAPASIDIGALKLHGIIARADGAAAIIETGNGRQQLVSAGGNNARPLLPGVTVVAIGTDHVILAVAGARHRLMLYENPVRATEAAASVAEPGDSRIAALAATSADWRTGLAAARRDGGIIGFAVVDTARLPLLRAGGLQRGDIITAINGSGLASTEKIIELPQEISGAYAAEIRFLRNGEPRETTVAIKR